MLDGGKSAGEERKKSGRWCSSRDGYLGCGCRCGCGACCCLGPGREAMAALLCRALAGHAAGLSGLWLLGDAEDTDGDCSSPPSPILQGQQETHSCAGIPRCRNVSAEIKGSHCRFSTVIKAFRHRCTGKKSQSPP